MPHPARPRGGASRWTRRRFLFLAGGAALTGTVIIGVVLSSGSAFCDAVAERDVVLEGGVAAQERGSIGFAEALQDAYAEMVASAPDNIEKEVEVVNFHNQFLAQAVIEAGGDMFSVAAQLPPGMVAGDELRDAEQVVAAYIDEHCGT